MTRHTGSMIRVGWRGISKRRGWDSNPRALADKRFSRPPRYDHFDTSPGSQCASLSVSAKVILPKMIFGVNLFFAFFVINFISFAYTLFNALLYIAPHCMPRLLIVSMPQQQQLLHFPPLCPGRSRTGRKTKVPCHFL